MAVFAQTQNAEPRFNSFYDLPNIQWHGSVLYDKNTFTVIPGFDTLNVPFSSNEEDIPGYFPSNTTINNIPNNMGFAPCTYFNASAYTNSYIPRAEESNTVHKVYIVDPYNDDLVYFLYVGNHYLTDQAIVKYSMNKQEILWARHLTEEDFARFTDFTRHKIWKITRDRIYLIGEINKNIASNENNQVSLGSCAYVLDKTNGKLISTLAFPDLCSTVYPAFRDSTSYASFSCGDVLKPVYETEGTVIFFAMFLCTKDVPGTVSLYRSDQIGFKAGFIEYDLNSMLFKSTTNKLFTSKITDEKVYMDALLANSGNANGKAFIYLPRSTRTNSFVPSGEYFGCHIPKATSVDNTIKDKITLYSCWGKLFSDVVNEETTQEYRKVYKFEYYPEVKVQKSSPMKVYNKNGEVMKYEDWIVCFPDMPPYNYDYSAFSHYDQPYIYYGENSKYLVICDFAFNSDKALEQCNELNRVHLFKFLDAYTLQLVDQMNITAAGIFWLNRKYMVFLKENSINFFNIDEADNAFKQVTQIIPQNVHNKFTFACIDDSDNFWYYESIYDEKSNTHIGSIANYLNPKTIKTVQILKPAYEIDLQNTEPVTSVMIGVISDFDELIKHKVEVSIIGNAIFEDNKMPVIQIETNTKDYTTLNVLVKGVGDIAYKAKLIDD